MRILLDNISFSLDNLSGISVLLLQNLENQRIICFEGEMGAGKTTLIKELCKTLGSSDNFSSPTYSIVNEYELEGGKIYHFDLYRVKDINELLDIGFEDYAHSGNYCFIEWPQYAITYLQHGFVKIELETRENNRYLRATQY